MSSSSIISSEIGIRVDRAAMEKSGEYRVETVEYSRTVSHDDPYYFDSDGLRIDGDGYDHTRYNPRAVAFVMTTLGCALALCGSQIVPLLYLTLVTDIAKDFGTPHLRIWLLSSFLVAQGAVAPFVGPMADLFGRKTIFLLGLICNVVGAIVCSVTPTAYGFIAGEVLMGFGTVIEELLAISVVGESVPTAKRPLYGALILAAIIPWSPGTMYANWIAVVSWRYIGLALGLWNFLNFVIIGLFYWPPPRINGRGLSRMEKFKRIDFVGGFLTTSGLIFVLVALNWGGQDYAWSSTRVVAFMLTGFFLLIAMCVWEWKLVTYPMFPRRIIHAPRPFICMMVVIFCAGINYIPLVVFWPVQAIAVYGADRFHVGVAALPVGVCMLGGAMISAVLLGLFKKWVTFTMFFFCAMQTIACACLCAVDKNDINTCWAPVIFALIGVGGVLVPNQVIVTVITPDDLIASVTALTVGLRSQAQVIGLAIFYNQLLNTITSNSYKYVVPVMLYDVKYVNVTQIYDMMNQLTAIPFSEYAPTVPQIASGANYQLVHDATVETFAQSFRHVYFLTIAFGGVACVAAAFMGSVTKYMDDHVAIVYNESGKDMARSQMELTGERTSTGPTDFRHWQDRHDPRGI